MLALVLLPALRSEVSRTFNHPGGNPGANLKSISQRCYVREVAFEWELTQETIYLPLGRLQGRVSRFEPGVVRAATPPTRGGLCSDLS